MKHLPPTLCLGFAVLAAGASAQTPTQPLNPRVGIVKQVQGALRLNDGNTDRMAAAGDAVHALDRMTTNAGGSATVQLRDGTVVVLGPAASALLERFEYDAATQEGALLVRLARGTLRMVSGLVAKTNPGRVGVVTNTANIGLRGTDLVVETTDEEGAP